MSGRFRALKLLAFVALAFGILVVGEVSQAIAESFLAADEKRMTALVNEHRKEHGLRALSTNTALKWVARRQAQRMVMAGYIYHNPDLDKEADKAIPGWLALAENVGVGSTAGSVQKAFLRSKGHHRNIHTKGFNIIGLGAMASDDGENLYFTQNFARYTAEEKKPTSGSSSSARKPAPKRTRPPVVRATKKAREPRRPSVQEPEREPTRRPTPRATPSVLSAAPVRSTPPDPVPVATASEITLNAGLAAMLGRFWGKLDAGALDLLALVMVSVVGAGHRAARRRLRAR